MISLVLIFIFNTYLSICAYFDEFNGVKMKAFQRIHWMLALFIMSLVLNYYQFTRNVEEILYAGGYGGQDPR